MMTINNLYIQNNHLNPWANSKEIISWLNNLKMIKNCWWSLTDTTYAFINILQKIFLMEQSIKTCWFEQM